MARDCEECAGLWREYAKATNNYIRLQNKLKIAEVSHDQEAVSALGPGVEQTASDRQAARNAIDDHEAAAHQKKRSLDGAGQADAGPGTRAGHRDASTNPT